MSREHRRKTDWVRTLGRLALAVWGLATVIAAALGIVWLSLRLGAESRTHTAIVAMTYATALNWVVFLLIERRPDQ